MFQILYIFGPASLTYMIVQHFTGKTAENWYTALIRLFSYAAIDAAVTAAGLLPFNRVEIILMPNGIKNIQYGGTAFLVSMAVGVVCALVIAGWKKRGDIRMEVTPNTKEKKHEEKN